MNKKLTSMLIMSLFLISCFAVLTDNNVNAKTDVKRQTQKSGPKAIGDFTEYNYTIQSDSYLKYCCHDTHNNHVYFTGYNRQNVGEIDESGNIYYHFIAGGHFPDHICFDSHNNCIFFTLHYEGLICNMTESGTLTYYTITGSPINNPNGICFDPHNNHIYCCENSANKICNMLEDGTMTEYTLLTPLSHPYGICFNSINYDLFITCSQTNMIVDMTEGGSMLEYSYPVNNNGDSDICFDSHINAMFFSEANLNQVCKFWESGGGHFYEIASPTLASSPFGICFDDNNNKIYFSENQANKICEMTESYGFTEWYIPTGLSGPYGMCFDSHDMKVYFCEAYQNKIAKLEVSVVLNPQLNNDITFNNPSLNENDTMGSSITIYFWGTGSDLDIVTVDCWLYYVSNQTSIHFLNTSATLTDSNHYHLSTWITAPSITSRQVCRIIVRCQDGNTVWGNSYPFTIRNPSISHIVTVSHPILNSNYTSGDYDYLFCNGTGHDLLNIPLNSNMWLYFVSNHTKIHFLNDSFGGDFLEYDTIYSHMKYFNMPTVATPQVCRLIVRMQLSGFDTGWGISDNFTINEVPNLNDDARFQTDYPVTDGNNTEGNLQYLQSYGTGVNLNSPINVDYYLYYVKNHTSVHFKNETATIKLNHYWYSNISLILPNVYLNQVVRFNFRVLLTGYNYVFGFSDGFTITDMPFLWNDTILHIEPVHLTNNYSEKTTIDIKTNGTGYYIGYNSMQAYFYIYFYSNHTSTFIKEIDFNTVNHYTYWYCNTSYKLPSVLSSEICRLWVNISLSGSNTVYCCSDSFTINKHINSSWITNLTDANMTAIEDGHYNIKWNVTNGTVPYKNTVFFSNDNKATWYKLIDNSTLETFAFYPYNYTNVTSYDCYMHIISYDDNNDNCSLTSGNFTIFKLGNHIIPPPDSQKPIYITLINSGEYHNGTGSMVEISSNSINFDFQIVCQDGISSARLNYIFTSNSTGLNNTGSLTLNLVGGDVYAGLWGVSLPAFNEEGILTFNVTATSEKALVEISENNTLYVIKGFSFYEIFYSFNFIILIAGIILAFFGFAIYRKHIFLGLVFMLFGSLAILYALFGIFLSLGLI